jgi:flagellin-like protein
MLTPRSASCRQGQWSLIGSLVAVAIIIVLAAIYLPRLIKPTTQSGAGATVLQKADGTACVVYQSQMNQAVDMYKTDHDGAPPRSIDQLRRYGVTDDMIHAPGCSFQIGPGGQVTETGHGQAVPAGPGAPGQTVPLPPSGGQPGPGGITIPNIPGAGG